MPPSKGKKRARANTAGERQPPAPALPTKPTPTAKEIATLDPAMRSALLFKAAEMHRDVSTMLSDAIESAKKSRQSRVITFDGYSSSIWREINVTYGSMSGSKQFDISFDVADDIKATIDEIVEQCDKYPNAQTRFNALSVLRKIGKTVFFPASDTLGREVQKQFSRMKYVAAMQHIVSAMSDEERENIVLDEMWPKLQELKEMLDDEVGFEDFQDVLDLLEGEMDEDDEEYEGDQESA